MTIPYLAELARRPEVVVAGLLLSVLALAWIVRRVRQVAKSERPDEPLSNLAMLIGLGWSSEAVWELTGRAGFPTSLRLLLFFVLETLLVLAMIRAKRAMGLHGHPGRSGRTAWIVASAMALVAAAISGSAAEAIMRLLIPLLVTLAWWDGLVGENAKRAEVATSWRWTPRRLLLWLGAVEPGERDIETVHRERLTQQMTRLEFRRRNGSERQQRRAAGKLARLSLSADDGVISEVRQRVDRASWFEGNTPARILPPSRAASAKSYRIRHGRRLMTVRLTPPPKPVIPAQPTRQDKRQTAEIDFVVAAIKYARPELRARRIAELAATSESSARRALQRLDGKEPDRINGNEPELQTTGS